MKNLFLILLFAVLVSCKDESQKTMFDDAKKVKDRSIETSLGTLEVTEGELGSFEQDIRKLNAQEKKIIQSKLAETELFIRKYSISGEDSKENDLRKLDKAFKAWLLSEDIKKPSNDETVQIIGAAFGQFMVDKLDMEWVIVKDKYGTDWGVQHKESQVISFPYSSVSKRIENREFDFMEKIFFIMKKTINENSSLAPSSSDKSSAASTGSADAES